MSVIREPCLPLNTLAQAVNFERNLDTTLLCTPTTPHADHRNKRVSAGVGPDLLSPIKPSRSAATARSPTIARNLTKCNERPGVSTLASVPDQWNERKDRKPIVNVRKAEVHARSFPNFPARQPLESGSRHFTGPPAETDRGQT